MGHHAHHMQMFKKKFFKSFQKALGDDLTGLLVYGGSATERIFPGVSDVDFFIIIKKVDELSKSLAEIFEVINTTISEYVSNPLFAAILDYEVYTEDQLPNGDDLNGFSAIRACALSTAEVLAGSNPFEGMKFESDELSKGARRMVQE